MNEIIAFFIQSEGWFYFVASIIAVVATISLIKNRRDWKLAVFSLEQEIVRRKIRNAVTWLILAIAFVVIEFSFVVFASVKYPNINLPTPTVSLMGTQPLDILPEEGNPGIVQTPVVQTAQGCTPGQIEWSLPRPGEQVQGQVDLKGTVNVSDLGFFKLEYRLTNSPNWVTIAGANKPVINDVLGGKWNASDLTPGDYELRIVVLDNANNPYPDCVITVHLVAP